MNDQSVIAFDVSCVSCRLPFYSVAKLAILIWLTALRTQVYLRKIIYAVPYDLIMVAVLTNFHALIRTLGFYCHIS